MIRLKHILTLIFALLFVFLLCGCHAVSPLEYIDGYAKYLFNFHKYNKTSIPTVSEFTPLINKYFDYAQPFYGNYAFAKAAEGNYIVSKNGIVETKLDLSSRSVSFDKYFFTDSDNLLCVNDIFGNTIIKGDYDDVKICGEAILAIKNTSATIFSGGNSREFAYKKAVNLLDEKTLLIDGRLYDFDINKLSYNNSDHLAIARSGMILVTRDGKLGYVSENGERFIEPQYDTANDFVNGYARVSLDKTTFIIDTSGKTAYYKHGVEPKNFYDNYFCYKKDGLIGVFDEKFNVIIEPRFHKVYMERAFGDYIIESSDLYMFYSIANKNYVLGQYQDIAPLDGYFICKTSDDLYSLLNKNLEVLAFDCKTIAFSHDILMIEKNGKFCYYAKQ